MPSTGRDHRILFLVDHKHRDLPSLALISHYLRARGRETRLVALWQEEQLISEFDPGFIVLPKPAYDNARLLRWYGEGRRLIVIDTEGAPQDITYRMRIEVPPDFYLFWSRKELEKYEADLPTGAGVVAGCPRLDFLHPSFSWLFPDRQSILQDLDLPETRKTITFATSTQDTHFSENLAEGKQRRRAEVLAETHDYRDIVANMRLLRDLTVDILQQASARYPDVNIIVKPHPNESVLFWRDVIAGLPNSDNARIMVGKTINELLQISDLHVTHNGCTTTFEAALAGVAVVEMQTDMSAHLLDGEHLGLAPYRIRDAAGFHNAVAAELTESAPRQSAREALAGYIEKHFHEFDGRRCLSYADQIDGFVTRCQPLVGRRRSVFLTPRLFRPALVAAYVRTRAWAARLLKPAPPPERLREENDAGGLDSRGRYDNRIKQEDVAEWHRRFAESEPPNLDVGEMQRMSKAVG